MSSNPFDPFKTPDSQRLDGHPSGLPQKRPDEIFSKARRGSGLAPKRKEDPVSEVDEPELIVEAEEPTEETEKVILTNPRWSSDSCNFNDTVRISVDAVVPSSLAIRTRIELELFALVPGGKRESILTKEAHIKEGSATTELTMYWPQYRENGALLEKCQYIFTAKHRESQKVESPPLEVTSAQAWLGQVWISLQSMKGNPLPGVACILKGHTKTFPGQISNKSGQVKWDAIPFDGYKIEIKIGSNILLQSVPWLLDSKAPHVQMIRNADKLLGSPSSVLGVQARLMTLGYDCGALDGIMGTKTKSAVNKFQLDRGVEPQEAESEELRDLLKYNAGA